MPDILESKLKKLSGKNKYPGKICIPITERSISKARRAINKANQLADLIELRLDYLHRPNLEELWPKVKKPLIVTNRLSKEGGKFKGREEERIGFLKRAMELGASFIDVELVRAKDFMPDFLRQRKETNIILSFHDFEKTISFRKLQLLLEEMRALGADVSKIVTFAQSWVDNLQIMNLIHYARQRAYRIVAFCMGEKGKISRLLSPLLGGEWTYVALDSNKKSAPGQLTIKEVKEIWRKLS